jgi:copper chaperone CopZ
MPASASQRPVRTRCVSTVIGQHLDRATRHGEPNGPRYDGAEKENRAVASQSFHIPTMTSRGYVRAISACISDVPGVRTVEARLDSRTVRVTGTADAVAVQSAIRAAGHEATAMPDGPEPSGADDRTTAIAGSPPPHTLRRSTT